MLFLTKIPRYIVPQTLATPHVVASIRWYIATNPGPASLCGYFHCHKNNVIREMDIKPRHSHDSWRMIIIASSHYWHDRPSVTISMRPVLRSHLHTAAWDSRIAIRIRHPLSASASPSAYGSLQRPTMWFWRRANKSDTYLPLGTTKPTSGRFRGHRERLMR